MSLTRTLIGMFPATILAGSFFGFSVYSLGLPLAGFFANLLIMGWAVGLVVSGIVLRWGLGAESLAWVALFALAPISGIYYPIEVLPNWLQPVSLALPSAHVFEGMRAILIQDNFRIDLMVNALLLNFVFLIGGAGVFLASFRAARVRGLLLQMGE